MIFVLLVHLFDILIRLFHVQNINYVLLIFHKRLQLHLWGFNEREKKSVVAPLLIAFQVPLITFVGFKVVLDVSKHVAAGTIWL